MEQIAITPVNLPVNKRFIGKTITVPIIVVHTAQSLWGCSNNPHMTQHSAAQSFTACGEATPPFSQLSLG
jgi:hypothetical protein